MTVNGRLNHRSSGDHAVPCSPTDMIAEAEKLVREHMAGPVTSVKRGKKAYDPSHDWAHVNRVRKRAMRIAKTLDGPDMLVVEIAALFHDMAAKYGRTSALSSILEPFFSSKVARGLRPDQVDLVLKIIPSVSWSTEKKLRAKGEWTEWHDACGELHAVQDADRLDAIGGVGILRCAAFSGAKGRKLLEDDEEGSSAEAHFDEKLLLIKDRMKTAAGKEEADRRHETMVTFLKALRQERDD